jgi:hypothetical protein
LLGNRELLGGRFDRGLIVGRHHGAEIVALLTYLVDVFARLMARGLYLVRERSGFLLTVALRRFANFLLDYESTVVEVVERSADTGR